VLERVGAASISISDLGHGAVPYRMAGRCASGRTMISDGARCPSPLDKE
jgi:hypothetical protein